jgi:hypothetical protein
VSHYLSISKESAFSSTMQVQQLEFHIADYGCTCMPWNSLFLSLTLTASFASLVRRTRTECSGTSLKYQHLESKFQASLDYIASLRQTWAISNPIANKEESKYSSMCLVLGHTHAQSMFVLKLVLPCVFLEKCFLLFNFWSYSLFKSRF